MSTNLLGLLTTHTWVSYLAMFVAMLIEGPTITTVGAFLARVGYFTVSMVFLISILGNFIPDVGYYALGRWGRGFIDRHPLLFSKLRITKENIARGKDCLRIIPL